VASITVEIRERRAALVELRRALKPVDSSLESLDRFILRIQARKQYLPDLAEAQRMSQMLVDVATSIQNATRIMAQVLDVFRF
jgi:prefoldin subunit 5